VREDDSNGEIISEYSYDSEGSRIKKIEVLDNGENQTTYYVSENFVQIVNSSGVFNFTYYYDETNLVAEKNSEGEMRYYHPDHLGSTTLITNEAGEVVEETYYMPYGDVIEGGEESRYGYTSKEKDTDTELMYYEARYYDPFLRHFIQPDNVIADVYNPQNLNTYSYVLNNPYKYVDPGGDEPVLPQIGSYETFYNQLHAFEATQLPGTTASQTLSNLVSFKGGFNSKLGNRKAFLYNSDARYVYTSDKGFVDNLHFITAAAQTKKSGALATRFGGIYVELRQLWEDPSSAFSYDDLPSNSLGIKFAGQLNNQESLSTQYSSFIQSIGGSTTPLATLESEHPGSSQNIPETGPSNSPSYTSYSSGGKALPKQSFFGKICSCWPALISRSRISIKSVKSGNLKNDQ